ncbi:MAG: hypothetical protein K6T78_10780 [Alicyclobacillus sp.]|nr:hypothetical protein [Alicyclobacillus sp.]
MAQAKQSVQSSASRPRMRTRRPTGAAQRVHTDLQHAIASGASNPEPETCFLPLFMLWGLWGGSRAFGARNRAAAGWGGGPGWGAGTGGWGAPGGGFGAAPGGWGYGNPYATGMGPGGWGGGRSAFWF